jgi:hypothetical protein
MSQYYTVCPSNVVFKKPGQQNCVIAFFFGKMYTVMEKCKRLILSKDFEPVWIRSPDFKYWVYSVSSPTRVTMKCQQAGPPQQYKPNVQKVLNNTGILSYSASCYVYAETFKLLPYSLGRTTVNLHKTHIVLPSVYDILNSEEKTLLQDHSNKLAELRQLDTIIQRATARSEAPGLEVNCITHTLRSSMNTESSSTMPWIIGLAVVGQLYFFYDRVVTPVTPNKYHNNLRSDYELEQVTRP